MDKINISSVPSFIYRYSVSSSKISIFHNIISLSLIHYYLFKFYNVIYTNAHFRYNHPSSTTKNLAQYYLFSIFFNQALVFTILRRHQALSVSSFIYHYSVFSSKILVFHNLISHSLIH